MDETDAIGVQGLASERNWTQRFRPVDVALLADERVAAQLGLHTNLVATPGPKLHLDQRGIAKSLHGAVVGDRLAAARVTRVG